MSKDTILNARACTGTTQQVEAIVRQAYDQGCTVCETVGTVIINHPDGFEIYRALKLFGSNAGGRWIVRYDQEQFPDEEYEPY